MSNINVKYKNKISAGPPGATRRRDKSNLPSSLFPSLIYHLPSFPLPSSQRLPLDMGPLVPRSLFLLTERARLGSHEVTKYHRGPIFSPAGVPLGTLKSSKTIGFMCKSPNNVPRMNKLEGYPPRTQATATFFQNKRAVW